MTPKTPAIARWLLDRFGIPQQNEPLVGDLVEEYGAGRSVLWFWRQVLVAIATTITRDVRNHRLLAAQAIATGWLLWAAWGQLMHLVEPRMYVSYPRGWNRMAYFEILFLLMVTVWPVLVGWVVARIHRAQQTAMVLVFAASQVIWFIGYYGLHYHEIQRKTIPNQAVEIVLTCTVLLMTLVGGFLQKPRAEARVAS